MHCRRNTFARVQLWLAERLLEAASQGLGSMLLGTWAASTFYRAFGAQVGRWATFRMSNVLTLPDMLDIGDWAHVGDTANIACKISLNENELLVAPVHVHSQAILGVGSVVLPGTVVGQGATLSAMACPEMGSTLKPGFIHMGLPAQPVIKAEPRSSSGEVPETSNLKLIFTVLPFVQLATALAGISFSIAAASMVAHHLRDFSAGNPFLQIAAVMIVTAVLAIALVAGGLAVKIVSLGQLQAAEGIQKYSLQNMARTLLWAVDAKALSLFGEAVRGSVWYNRVLRTRGLRVGRNVYLDTLFAGDYELVSYGSEAVVDRDALIFAHLGLYKNGSLAMSQKNVEVKDKAVIGARAAILPGSVLESEQSVKPGAVKLQF